MAIRSGEQLRKAVSEVLRTAPAADMHTRLTLPEPGGVKRYGIDALLTVPELTESMLRLCPELRGGPWDSLAPAEQAERVWDAHFVKRTPSGEACLTILSVLHTLGLRPDGRRLPAYRDFFERMSASDHMELMFKLAGLTTVCLSFDPFSPAEQEVWERFRAMDPRWNVYLRLNVLIEGWSETWRQLREWGYDTEEQLTEKTAESVRRFLRYWIARLDPLYLAYDSLSPMEWTESSIRLRLIRECVIPVAGEAGIPIAFRLEGIPERLDPLESLVCGYPGNKFIGSARSQEPPSQLARLAKKHGNLHLFGCGSPRLPAGSMEPILRIRMESLGVDYTPLASEAVVWDALLPAWIGGRSLLAKLLTEKYSDLMKTGWQVAQEDIVRDAAALLGESFWRFLGRPNPALPAGS